jgi:hypothetical protein
MRKSLLECCIGPPALPGEVRRVEAESLDAFLDYLDRVGRSSG